MLSHRGGRRVHRGFPDRPQPLQEVAAHRRLSEGRRRGGEAARRENTARAVGRRDLAAAGHGTIPAERSDVMRTLLDIWLSSLRMAVSIRMSGLTAASFAWSGCCSRWSPSPTFPARRSAAAGWRVCGSCLLRRPVPSFWRALAWPWPAVTTCCVGRAPGRRDIRGHRADHHWAEFQELTAADRPVRATESWPCGGVVFQL